MGSLMNCEWCAVEAIDAEEGVLSGLSDETSSTSSAPTPMPQKRKPLSILRKRQRRLAGLYTYRSNNY